MAGEGDGAGGPRRVLYGRSRGKALRVGQARLLADRLPELEIEPAALGAGPLFAPAPVEIWLEIGFGGGEHLIAAAKANPQVGLIGCEPFLNGVAKALAALEAEGLANVRLRRGDAQSLVEAAPQGYFSRVFILYPDPWPKRRHNKRRIVSSGMVAELARAMRPGAELRFVTDIDDYAGWTLRRLLDSAEFEWTARTAADWREPWAGWSSTRYEAKARRAGRAATYLTFVRR